MKQEQKDSWLRRMGKKYQIPAQTLNKMLKRDRLCVYCHKIMVLPKKGAKQRDWITIEHMADRASGNNDKTIALCCGRCNSSRRMSFEKWFKTPYCINRGINKKSVAEPVKAYLKMIARLNPKDLKKYIIKNY